MDPNTFPTKGNLILAKNSLALSRQGFELMDKKRNILIREMMELIDQAKDIQAQIDETFRTAYAALQKANMELGIAFVQQVSYKQESPSQSPRGWFPDCGNHIHAGARSTRFSFLLPYRHLPSIASVVRLWLIPSGSCPLFWLPPE